MRVYTNVDTSVEFQSSKKKQINKQSFSKRFEYKFNGWTMTWGVFVVGVLKIRRSNSLSCLEDSFEDYRIEDEEGIKEKESERQAKIHENNCRWVNCCDWFPSLYKEPLMLVHDDVCWMMLTVLSTFSWKWHWLFQGGGGDGSVLKPCDPVSTCYQMYVSFLFREVERVSLYSHIKALHFSFSYKNTIWTSETWTPPGGKIVATVQAN